MFLTVESDVENVVCLDEVDVFVKELDTLFVVDYGAGGLLFAAKAFACFLYDLAQRWLVVVAKVHRALLLRLVNATVESHYDLNTHQLPVRTTNFAKFSQAKTAPSSLFSPPFSLTHFVGIPLPKLPLL